MRRLVLASLFLPMGALAYACSGDDDGGGGGGGGPDASSSSSSSSSSSGGSSSSSGGNDSGFNFDGSSSSGGDAGDAGDAGKKDGGDGGDGGFPFPLIDGGEAGTPSVFASDDTTFYFLDGVTISGGRVVWSDVFTSRYNQAFDAGGGITPLANVGVFSTPIGNAVFPDGGGGLFSAYQVGNAIVKEPGPAAFSTGPATGFDQPNDLVITSAGVIYVTDPYDYAAQTNNGGVYRIPAAGGTAVLEHDYGTQNPNGIALSPDEKTLYVSITEPLGAPAGTGTVKKFTIDGTGKLGTETAFASGLSTPDGLGVDDAGNVYVCTAGATPTTGKVQVFSPAGTKLGEIVVPRSPAVSLAFGGVDRKTLYIAAGDGAAGAGNLPAIYQVRVNVPGKP